MVGIGAFALANKAGKGNQSAPPQVNCSPRRCFFISNTEPCQCNTTLTSGGVCGSTTNGVGYAGGVQRGRRHALPGGAFLQLGIL